MKGLSIRKNIAFILVLLLLFSSIYSLILIHNNNPYGLFFHTVYGANGISINDKQSFSVMQGEEGASISVEFTYTGGTSQSIYAVISNDSDFTFSKTKYDTSSNAEIVHMDFDVRKSARTGDHSLEVKIFNSDDLLLGSGYVTVEVAEKSNVPGGTSASIPSVDLSYTLTPSGQVLAENPTQLQLDLFNRGNTVLKNLQVSLTLPEGITINDGSASKNIGYMFIGDRATAKFNIVAEKGIITKNYPVTVEMKFKDSGNSDGTLSETIYLSVKGKDKKVEDEEEEDVSTAEDVYISNMVIKDQAQAGESFTLSFDVTNKGQYVIKDLTVTAAMPEGVVNTTKNVFASTNVQPGAKFNYQVTMKTSEKAEENYYPIKITAESKQGETTASSSQYAGIFIKASESATKNEKTPQLLVSHYGYGGTYVQAGDKFTLQLQFLNASSEHNLRNIKVSVNSADGTFVPVNSSNSFFIDSLGKKKTISHNMKFSAVPEAEQKTKTMSISMSYEDMDGNAFTAEDTISIPIMQETRLMIDEIIAPPEVYAGMPNGTSVSFYNMGKTVLNNLRVDVDGNFSSTESNLYYVGNMEPGKSDSFDFSFTPTSAEPLKGTIVFTYEDATGKEITYERSFEFPVMAEVPTMGDNVGKEEMPAENNKIPWLPIGIGGGVLLIALAILILRKRRKRKLDQEMSLDE